MSELLEFISKMVAQNTHGEKVSKRAGGFDNELRKWMKSTILKDLVHDIHRLGYMTVTDFEQALENPDWSTWNLLTLDVFQKRLLRG